MHQQVFIKIERVPNYLDEAPEEIRKACVGLYMYARLFDPKETYFGVLNHKKIPAGFNGFVIEATEMVNRLHEARKFDAYDYWTKRYAISSDSSNMKFIVEKSVCRTIKT